MSDTPSGTPTEHVPGDQQSSPGFFDNYSRFQETSRTAASNTRLNLRHEAIIEDNSDVFDGARVLDLASHDGRWSFAALQAGARHVTGVEARSRLIDQARKTFTDYRVKARQYSFVCGDVFDVLAHKRFKVDVVLCLGFLYHTLRYPELLSAVRRLNPQHLVLDTKITRHEEPVIALTVNDANVESHAAADAYSRGKSTLAGWPSMYALTRMLHVYDFDLEHTYDWAQRLAGSPRPGLKDYATGERVTMRFRSR